MSAPLRYLDEPGEMAKEKARFVEAALELLNETDTVDLQVSQVVRRAGRHNAAFYRVFGTKQALVLAVVEEASSRTAALMEERVRASTSPADAVRSWARVPLGLATTPRTAGGARALALDRFRLLHAYPEAEAMTSARLRDPLLRLLQDAGVPDAPLRADAALELVMSRQASWIALGHRPRPAEVEAFVELVVELVRLP